MTQHFPLPFTQRMGEYAQPPPQWGHAWQLPQDMTGKNSQDGLIVTEDNSVQSDILAEPSSGSWEVCSVCHSLPPQDPKEGIWRVGIIGRSRESMANLSSTCDTAMSGQASAVHLRPSLFPWVPPFLHFPKLRDGQEGQETWPTDSRVQIVWKVRQSGRRKKLIIYL